MYGKKVLAVPGVLTFSSSSLHAFVTRYTLQRMIFPFMYDWVLFILFSLTAYEIFTKKSE